MSIIDCAHNLTRGQDGIFRAPSSCSVSYPEDGHAICFQLEDRSFWFQHRNECIAAAVKRFSPDGPILEVGGGNGYVSRRLIDEGFDCVLLEPGNTGATNARARGIENVICATLEEAQFEKGSLSAIAAFDVIEHIENDRAFIGHCSDVLKPGGLLYGTLPAHQTLWSMHDVTAGHYRRHSKDSLMELLNGKFELLYFTYFFASLIVPIYITKALPYKLFGASGLLSKNAEHGSSGGLVVDILRPLLKKEVCRVSRGERMRVGASCLFVAKNIKP